MYMYMCVCTVPNLFLAVDRQRQPGGRARRARSAQIPRDQTIYLSIYLSIYLYLSIFYLSIYLHIYLSIYLSI